MAFSSMADALKNKMGTQTPLRAQVEAALIIQKAEQVFNELFGEETKHIKVLYIKNRTLTLTCHSSVIAQEIRLNQAKIIEKLTEAFPGVPIERIRYLA